jgi:hypothetical protein
MGSKVRVVYLQSFNYPFPLTLKKNAKFMLQCLTMVRNKRLKRQFKCNNNRLHAGSAVNADDLSVDPVTVLRSEEADDTGNVDGLTDTVVRRPCAGVLVDLVIGELVTSGNVLTADSVVHVGLDATGGDAVDGNLLLASIWCLLAADS